MFKQKCRSQKGFMLIEMLAVIVVVVLLAIGIGTGLNAGVLAYRESIYESNSATLSDILNTSMGDVLRYSTDVVTCEDQSYHFTFTSYDYNVKDAHFDVDENGKVVMIFTKTTKDEESGATTEETVTVQLVNDGAYTEGMTVAELEIVPVEVENGFYFDISYKIVSGDDHSSDYFLRVRQANADIKAVIDDGEPETETETETEEEPDLTVVFDSGVETGERMVFTNVFGGKSASVTKTVRGNSFSTNVGEVSRRGYTITGWSTTKGSDTVEYGLNTDVEVTDSMKETAKANGNIITLYAVWDEMQYRLVYVAGDGATGSYTQEFTINTSELTLCSNVGLGPNGFKKEGHTVTFHGNGAKINGYDTTVEIAHCSLLGWTIGQATYGVGENLTVKDNDALWNQVDSATGEVIVKAKWSDAKVTTPAKDKVTRANWTVWGFSETQYLGSEMEKADSTQMVAFGKEITVNKDTDYYVQCSCTVKYYSNKNFASDKLKATETYYDGIEYKLASPSYYKISKTGYTFAGWCTYIEGKSAKVGMAGALYTPKGDTQLYAKFSENTYTVIFHKNDGTDITVKKEVKYTVEFALTTDFERIYTVTFNANSGTLSLASTTAEWTLDSWNNRADGTGDKSYSNGQLVSKLTSSSKTEVHLYAQWTGGKMKEVPTGSKTNWKLYNWKNVTDDNTIKKNEIADFVVTKDLNIKVRWSCTVQYDINGGSSGKPIDETYVYDHSFKFTTTVPKRTGYAFKGWFKTKTDSTALTEETAKTYVKSTGNTTLYAQWEANSYTVVFHMNYGTTDTVKTKTFKYDEAGTLSGDGFTRSYTVTFNRNGGKLDGIEADKTLTADWTIATWNNQSDGKGSTSYTYGQSVSNLSETSGDEIHLYAQWMGGKLSSVPVATRNKWEFKEWKSSGGASISSDSLKTKQFTAAETYTAQWKCTVSYSLNGGTGTVPASQTFTYGSSSFSLATCSGTKTGHDYAGWFKATTGGEKLTNTTAAAYINSTGNTTLYAQWKPYTYTVIFCSNDGTNKTVEQSFTYGIAQNLKANSFTARSYTITFEGGNGTVTDKTRTASYSFNGWNTKENGSGTGYSNQQSVSNLTATKGGKVYLYAQWTGGKITSVPKASRTNWDLADWKNGTTGSCESNSTILNKQFTANTTYTAQWKCTVSFETYGHGTVDPVTVREGESVTLKDSKSMIRTGAIFAGWRIEGTETKVSSPYTPTSGHVTLCAYWITSTYVNVPEAIYLKPESGTMKTLQYFVNNTFNKDTKITTLDASASATSGKFNFYNEDAITLTVTVKAGSTSSTTLVNNVGISSVSGISGGGSYSGTVSSGSFSSSGLSSNGTELAEWQFTYKLRDGTTRTTKAYTVLYAPRVDNSSVAASVVSTRGVWGLFSDISEERYNAYTITRQATWIAGIHSASANPSGATNKGSDSDKRINIYTGSYRNYLITSTIPACTAYDAQQRYVTAGGTGAGQYCVTAYTGLGVYLEGANGYITVDNSRYNNYSQIPNLKVGLDLIYAFCYKDYQITIMCGLNNNTAGYEVLKEYKKTNKKSQVKVFEEIINCGIASASSQDISYQGRVYTSRNGEDTDVSMKVVLKATIVDKSSLRNLVLAVSKLGIQSSWLNGVKGTDGSTLTFDRYQNAMKNAYRVLGNPMASSSDISTAYNNLSIFNVEAKNLSY